MSGRLPSERTEVFRSATLIGGLTLASRVLGMARDVLSAALFGAGMVWDAFIIAWTVPNLFRGLFGEGALSSTFIPVYSQAVEEGPPDRPARVANSLAGAMVLVLGTTAVLGALACLLLPVLAGDGGAPEGKFTLTVWMTALLLPYLVFVCLAALFSAVLNVHKRFLTSAACPVLLNGFWIGGLAAGHWLFPGDARSQIWLVCGALLAGGVAELLVLLPESFALLGKPRLVSGLRDPDVRRIATLGLPVLFGLGVLQASILLNRIVAEVLVPGHGAVSALYYGNRLMQFPLGIIGVAVSTAAFPVLSKLAARGDLPKMNRAMGSALRGAFFLSLPAGVGLAVLAVPIVQLLLGHGAFRTDPEAGFRTGRVLALYALGVPACCLVPVAARAFYALKDMKTPTRIALASMVVNLAVGLALVWPLEEAGLALGTSASATFNLGALLWVLRRRVGFRVGAEFLLPGLKGAVSTAAMTAACVAVWKFLPILKGDSLSPQFARLAVAIGMSVAIFFLASLALNDANLKVFRRRGEPAAA